MVTVNELRNETSDIQRNILNEVWLYYLKNKEWVTANELKHKVETEEIVLEDVVKELGGSVIFENWFDNAMRYRLTLLGLLLSDYAGEVEYLLESYLEYVVERFQKNSNLVNIKGSEYIEDKGVSNDLSKYTAELLQISRLWGGSASFGSDEWQVGLPKDISRLRFEKNLLSYIHNNAIEYYDLDSPVSERESTNKFLINQKEYMDEYLAFSTSTSDEKLDTTAIELSFDFLVDINMKKLLVKDWKEVTKTHNAEAWKACLILCGGLVEGMLLDVLKNNNVFQTKKKKRSFNELIDIANEKNILSAPTVSLADAIRGYRNLAHPECNIRENIRVEKTYADTAFHAVTAIHGELSEYIKRSNSN